MSETDNNEKGGFRTREDQNFARLTDGVDLSGVDKLPPPKNGNFLTRTLATRRDVIMQHKKLAGFLAVAGIFASGIAVDEWMESGNPSEQIQGPTEDEPVYAPYGIFYGDLQIHLNDISLSVISKIPDSRYYDILQVDNTPVNPYHAFHVNNPSITNLVPTRSPADWAILLTLFRSHLGTSVYVPLYVELDSILNDSRNPSSIQDRIVLPFEQDGRIVDPYGRLMGGSEINVVTQTVEEAVFRRETPVVTINTPQALRYPR